MLKDVPFRILTDDHHYEQPHDKCEVAEKLERASQYIARLTGNADIRSLLPRQRLTITADEAVRASYRWADLIVRAYGDHARAAVQIEIEAAQDKNDIGAHLGWSNIQFALTDLWRWPLPGETVH